MSDEKFTDYTVKCEVKSSTFDYVTSLRFDFEWQAEAFQKWIASDGIKGFEKWLKTNEENFQ